jgi:hypothetical protein
MQVGGPNRSTRLRKRWRIRCLCILTIAVRPSGGVSSCTPAALEPGVLLQEVSASTPWTTSTACEPEPQHAHSPTRDIAGYDLTDIGKVMAET